ncbi:MAG: MFS transporter [Acidimicrobiales bacterium]
MRPFRLACLAYLGVALPGSTLGLLWPSMRVSFHEPVGALGIFLAFGVATSVIASALTGPILSRVSVGPLMALGIALVAMALSVQAAAPSFVVLICGAALFSLGFGALDSALNAHAAGHFGPRDINWMHASFGLGATIGPLLVTAVLADGLSWRWADGAMAIVQGALACVFVLTRRNWDAPAKARPPARPAIEEQPPQGVGELQPRKPALLVVISALTFSAVETGIESGAGIWGYLFLTAGRGLPHALAGVAVSAYWAMMFLGRAVLGPVAERAGAARVLGAAVVGVALGAGIMTVPGPGVLAVIGMMTVGVAAAPIFPLLTLTTAQRSGAANVMKTTRTVSFQVAASTIGGAALPAGIGLAIGALNAKVLAPSLLVLGLAMCGVYWAMSSLEGRALAT